MPYTTEILPAVSQEIQRWALPEPVWMDVLIYLLQTLAAAPPRELRRVTQPFDGMVAALELSDPEISGRRHGFLFHVMYRTDEQHLCVIGAAHLTTYTA